MDLETFLKTFVYTSSTDEHFTTFQGFTGITAGEFKNNKPDGFYEYTLWFDKHRIVWVSDVDRTIITFCEGDIFVQRYTNADAYLIELNRQQQFYCPDEPGEGYTVDQARSITAC
jgi:hypothetical protein